MTSKERYKQIIKENNEIISYLSNSYQNVANIYTKKARGFGVKSLDTEVKIKKVLEEIRSFDEKHIDVNIAIPNMTTYIEDNIKLLSKAPSKKYKIQEIAAVTILIASIVAYFIIDKACSKDLRLGEPKNVVITVNPSKDDTFYLYWQANEYAKNGYSITIYKDGEEIKGITIPYQVKDASDDYLGNQYYQTDIIYVEGSVYVFEIYAIATTEFGTSDIVKITYPSET